MKTISKQTLVTLLDDEIQKKINEEQRPGWSIWAICGALAACVWLSLSLLETSTHIANAFFIFLIVSITYDRLVRIYRVISIDNNESYRIKGFYQLNQIINNPIGDIWDVFRLVIIIYLACLFRDRIYSLLFYLLVISYGIELIVSTILLIFYNNSTFPIAYNSKFNIVAVIFGIVDICVIVWFVSLLSITITQYRVYDFKMGFLIWVISFLVTQLTLFFNNPLSQGLMSDIKKRLLLGEISIADASKRFDMLLNGLEVSDVLETDIKDILSLIDKFNALYKLNAVCYRRAFLSKKRIDQNEFNKECSSMDKYMKSLKEVVALLKKKVKKLRIKIIVLIVIKPEIIETTNKILGTVYKELDNMQNTINDFQKQKIADNAKNIIT